VLVVAEDGTVKTKSQIYYHNNQIHKKKRFYDHKDCQKSAMNPNNCIFELFRTATKLDMEFKLDHVLAFLRHKIACFCLMRTRQNLICQGVCLRIKGHKVLDAAYKLDKSGNEGVRRNLG
jgi:hypothetical protein